MRTRILVAVVALPLVVLPVWFGGVWFVALLVGGVLVASYEFYNLLRTGGYHPSLPLGFLWAAAFILNGWQPDRFPLTFILSIGLVLAITVALFQTDHPVTAWMSTSIVAIYLGTMFGQGVALRVLPDGRWWFLFGLLVAWANDSGAYFIGVTWGKHKLWPRLSPQKSWEGSIGGWIVAAVCGALLVYIFPLERTVLFGILIGTLGGVLALLGDLCISMLKRQVGVKDSGHLFPGHGGMLDRLDSLLFVIPFVYLVVTVFP